MIGVDYLAVSFPRCGEDLNYARRLARDAGCDAKIVAKVERAEAVCSQDAMDDIILASDVVVDPSCASAKPSGNHGDPDDGVNDY
ncbi:pyruvate kinase [Shigella sonnei]|nr:pyruvate kinase [Shigella sonnei]